MVKNKGFRFKAIYRFLSKSSKNPEGMARGVGIGLFVGFLPAIGFQIVLAVLIARLLSGNSLAAAIGTLVTNPLTTIPVSAFTLWLGDLILPGERLGNLAGSDLSFEILFNNPSQIGIAFLTGSLVLSMTSGIRIPRTTLYRMLWKDVNPNLKYLIQILNFLNLRLWVVSDEFVDTNKTNNFGPKYHQFSSEIPINHKLGQLVD